MEKDPRNNSEVSPATTLPWPYIRHSDDEYDDDDKEKMTPLRTDKNIPTEITAARPSINDTGKKYTLADDDEDEATIDLIGIANQIESQERGYAYEQEKELVKEVELVTQNDRAAVEAARKEAEEAELRAIEKEEIEKLKEANVKKRKTTKKSYYQKD
jgi:hypothetical protein